MMYRCNHCGCEFDSPAEWEEDRGEYWGSRCAEKMTGCPMCYSGNYDIISEESEEEEW